MGAPEFYIFTLNLEMRADPEPYISSACPGGAQGAWPPPLEIEKQKKKKKKGHQSKF